MNKIKEKNKQGLAPLNGRIQICKICGKIDAYAGDNHTCDREFQEYRRESSNN